MQVTARSRCLTVGVGLATASVLALSPTVVSTHGTPLFEMPTTSSAAVNLAADYNPWQAWIDAFETADAGAEQIREVYRDAPAALLQQFLANQIEYIREVLEDPRNVGTVLHQIATNIQSSFVSGTLLGFDQNTQYALPQQSLDGWHDILRQSIPKILVEGTPPVAKEIVQQLLNVLSSPLSGVAIGLAGPFISPVVALLNSIHEVGAALVAGDLTTAVHTIIDIPADMVGAALNGATLNLDGLAPVLNKIGLLTGTTLHNLNIQFGGLFSAGVTGVYEDGIGGSIFNAIGLNTSTDMMGFPLDLEIAGRGIGPIAALVSLGQILAKAIGGDVTAPAAAPNPAAQSTATTNESPTALPNETTPVAVVAVSEDTVTDADPAESIDDADTGAAASDGTTEPPAADGAEDVDTPAIDAEGTQSDPSDDAEGPKAEPTTERRSGKPTAASVSARNSASDDGGAGDSE